jgi:hypothetical protein
MAAARISVPIKFPGLAVASSVLGSVAEPDEDDDDDDDDPSGNGLEVKVERTVVRGKNAIVADGANASVVSLLMRAVTKEAKGNRNCILCDCMVEWACTEECGP